VSRRTSLQSLAIGSVAVTVIVVGVAFLRARSERIDRELADRTRITALEDEVGSLRRVVADVSRPTDRIGLVPVLRTSSAEPTPAKKSVTMEEMQATVAARFEDEAFDEAWRNDAERVAREQVALVLQPDDRLLSLECRSSLCRVRVSFVDMNAYKAFFQGAMHSPDFQWEGPKMSFPEVVDRAGRVTAVEFLGRRGRPLYQPDESP
jgi:hypothetical protein